MGDCCWSGYIRRVFWLELRLGCCRYHRVSYCHLVVTVMYITFIFSYTELTTSIPHAGGAFAYAYRAMGPIAGLIAGYATLLIFLFATPAIAFAFGSYLHFLYPAIPVLQSALFLTWFL